MMQLHKILIAMKAPGCEALVNLDCEIFNEAKSSMTHNDTGLSKAELLANVSNLQKRVEASLDHMGVTHQQEES